MQRRSLLLFALFVVTAWFYASVADDSSQAVANTHQKQVQMLEKAEQALSGDLEAPAATDQG